MDGMAADKIPNVRYPGGWNDGGQDSGCDISGWNVGRKEFRMGDIRVECQGGRIPDVRHPDKVERWPDRIPEVRRPGGMSENFCLGGMNDATYRKGLSARLRERESCGSF